MTVNDPWTARLSGAPEAAAPPVPVGDPWTLRPAPGPESRPMPVPESAPEPMSESDPVLELESTASESTVLVGRSAGYDFLLRLDDGRGIPVDRPLLLGRRPSPESEAIEVRLVVVDDPQRTVSRSHLLVEPVDAGMLLHNRSTVNPIVLLGPDGSQAEVGPGGAITVTGACRIVVGASPISVEPA